MSKVDWLKKLGWNQDQIEDLRLAGYAYIRQGKYDIALPIFKGIAALVPDSAYDAQTLGALYLEVGDADNAVKELDRALKLDADHTPTLMNFIKALLMLNRIDEALKLAEILTKEPDPYIANMAKALILAYGE